MQRYIDLVHYYQPPESDSSLKPGERRAISLQLARSATAVDARLTVRFVIRDPEDPLAKAARLDPAHLSHLLLVHPCSGSAAPEQP